MIGTLGRYACRLVSTSVPGFTVSPDAVTVEEWDSAPVDRGGWATGAGPVTAVVPVDGVYQVSVSAQALASDSSGTPVPVQAQVRAGFDGPDDGLLLALESPAWVTDDGQETLYVSGSSSGLVRLTAGWPVAVSVSVGNADPAVTDVAIYWLAIDLVRVASA